MEIKLNVFGKIIRSRLIWNSGIASIDQALLSFINFFISIMLIKAASKIDYGYYSVAFPVSLFFVSLQNAIINTPLTVLLPEKKNDTKQKYLGSLFHGQYIFGIPLVFITILVIFLLWVWGLDSIKAIIAASLCLAAIGLLYREFLRTCFFAEERSINVLSLDSLYAVFFVGMTLLLFWYSKLGVARIFLIMGVASFLASLIFNRKSKWIYDKHSVRESYKENWKFGRWALVGVIITHVQKYSYLYLMGFLLGSVSVAEVSASRLLLMPLLFVQAGWSKIIIPYGSRLREEQRIKKFFREQIIVSIFFVCVITIYTASIFFFSDFLKWFILSEKYANSFDYIGLWGIVFALSFLNLNASYGLQVIKKFDIISKFNFVTMIITIICAYLLIQSSGVEGGLYSLIIGEGTLAVFLWIWFGKAVLDLRLK